MHETTQLLLSAYQAFLDGSISAKKAVKRAGGICGRFAEQEFTSLGLEALHALLLVDEPPRYRPTDAELMKLARLLSEECEEGPT